MILVVATIVLVAYFLGALPFGLLVGRVQGIDVRTLGSGNIGATNVWRMVGKKSGVATFLLDATKGWLAVTAGMWIATHWAIHIPLPHDHERIEYFDRGFAGITAALGCILGHNFPLWLGFRGGKGVATSVGVIFGMMPLASIIIFLVWGIVLKATGYVALASMVAALAFPVTVIILLFAGWVHGWAFFYFACAAALLVVVRHRENIRRLAAGTEHRFGTPRSAPDEESPEPPPPPTMPTHGPN